VTEQAELEELAAGYYLDPPADVWLEERVQAWIMPRILGHVEGRTLEMGWGTGLVARYLLRSGVDLEIVEGSNRLATEARAHEHLPGKVHQTLFEAFSPGPIFDTVLCLHVLEHVDDPVGMLRRISTWLRPGGKVIVVTPNAGSVHRRVGVALSGGRVFDLSERDKLVGHRRVFVYGELIETARAAGFTVSGTFGWFLKPVNNARMVDWPPELIDALCEVGFRGDWSEAANIGLVAHLGGTVARGY
jgi:2-polyprenyl-3-methyl-5-hydroxy-6-metoxy-1,4-benzoquinol methylase